MTVKTLNHEAAIGASPSREALLAQQRLAIAKCAELAALVDRHTSSERSGYYPTAIDPLVFVRCDNSKTIQDVSEPLFAIVVQGEKKLSLNDEVFQYGVAQYLVMSVDLPLSVCMIEATPDQPYLGLKLKLDPVQLCEIIAQTNPDIDKQENSVRGWCVSDAGPSLIDCAIRLATLLDTPQDIPFLAPMIVREIYYRLLTDKQGEAVRQIATSGSNMQRIAEVIRQIKAEFTKPLRVEELAEQANMSAASFHRHFKTVTSMSPLQYQKHLRLLTARQMMLGEAIDATQAAYRVGYESTSQFSREYSRMFGAPPMRDIERLRTA
ncbi:AraC family transcriptional regulator [Oculatella sp. FACHB-28]|uniref:AraC family transcriptional regulator n=1 Tax=Cyanophyceae TaxID=3028117 RepID=UPI0016878EB2|nr:MULTISPECIES: AraC family transcriptional regulator [Cyanophyceae]MBD1997989.1 AraC family transcriptional regulator [Leptolyngbya sp. FACHB-541]MBD2056081.1 AraC family transcriptional regulator [Oculatella sp. FACHB-28]MBD2071996.1 AraC family transcriptional regulator [Leptolyngbya sp. FACHB-671]